ncbi:MAG: FAD-dependent oxidoreductase [Propionibacteriaceae bacterium]|nr:FAD-dependent oxidoreductase [Propionibacteriaceae bacterium]
MADFDAIVVGSGCAGPVAAHELATRGKSVLVIERGNFAGAKNVSGGRLYTHALREVFPNFRDDAPLERRVVRERISMLEPEAGLTIEFSDEQMRDESQDSYTVLRAQFDPWLVSQAEAAGAEYIHGIAVESLIKDGNRVTGVSAGGDEISADVVILCDGVNSLLAEQAVGTPRPSRSSVAVGIKQVIELDEHVINERFTCSSDEGAAWLFMGDATHGHVGGGFLYTNKNSISLGLVVTVADMVEADTTIAQLLEDFRQHPVIAPVIAGGAVVEHSGHLVAEGGYNALPTLIGDGVMLAGESAMMCLNAGYTVRGMDLAIAAGMHAGRSAATALDNGDTSSKGLGSYVKALEDSFVIKDMKTLRRFPDFMEHTPRMFSTYPELACSLARQMFLVDGTPMKPVRKKAWPLLKDVGLFNLLKDARKGVKAL